MTRATPLAALAIGPALILLAACDPQADGSPEPASPAPSAAAPIAAAGRPVAQDGQNYAFDTGGELQIVGPPNQYDIVLPTDVLFDFDKDQLRPDSGALLAKLQAHFETHDADQLHVTGHTDSKGDDVYNLKLSQRRAVAVCDWLKANTDEDFTNCIGAGEKEPVATNTGPGGADDPVGRQKNRRVNIRVIAYPDAGGMMDQAKRQADEARANLPNP